MSYTSSPPLSSATPMNISMFDLDDEFTLVSTLNPDAPAFVPSSEYSAEYSFLLAQVAEDSEEAMRVDDLMGVFHHLVGVYDSEHESLAEQFANADVPEDDDIAYLLDREDSLRSGLHVPAQKPKGVTYGRKVNRSRSRKPRGVY